jgi:sugar phosphate isomerase/epimerase
MKLGIFAYTFVRPTVAEVFDAIKSHGLSRTEWSFAAVGLNEVPTAIDHNFAVMVREEAAKRDVIIDSIDGYVNMVDPDSVRRGEAIQSLCRLIREARSFGVDKVALCTGTRDPKNKWRWHPENNEPSAWQDLCVSMAAVIEAAEESDITLVFEPEVNNVVHTAQKARRLLDDMASSRLKVVFDGANIFHKGELSRQHEILGEAIGILGPDIVLAHAKDIDEDGDAGHVAAGQGKLDYPFYLRELRRAGFAGTILLHGLKENDVEGAVRLLRHTMEESQSDY